MALDNAVKRDCSAHTGLSSNLCIPSRTQIIIGSVSNGGAAANANNIFASNGVAAYDQAAILAKLASQIPAIVHGTNINGAMQWSLNHD